MSKLFLLIVEDEAIVAEDLAIKVRQLGYEVAGITATGEKAVELARQMRPALVLMDVFLAGAMDGITAAQQIYHECNLPRLFLTAHSDESTVMRAQQAGALGYILKPFCERDLRVQIEMALYKHDVERQLRESEDKLRKFNIALQREVAERKLAEEALQTLNEALEKRVEERTRELQESQKQVLHAEKLSAIGQLSASIAHEVNNPCRVFF